MLVAVMEVYSAAAKALQTDMSKVYLSAFGSVDTKDLQQDCHQADGKDDHEVDSLVDSMVMSEARTEYQMVDVMAKMRGKCQVPWKVGRLGRRKEYMKGSEVVKLSVEIQAVQKEYEQVAQWGKKLVDQKA